MQGKLEVMCGFLRAGNVSFSSYFNVDSSLQSLHVEEFVSPSRGRGRQVENMLTTKQTCIAPRSAIVCWAHVRKFLVRLLGCWCSFFSSGLCCELHEDKSGAMSTQRWNDSRETKEENKK